MLVRPRTCAFANPGLVADQEHRGGPPQRSLATPQMAGHRSASPHERARALAQQVRALREDRGRTRDRLAKEAGITVGTLSRLESEGAIQPGFLTVGSVAEALAVSLDDLFRAAQVATVTPGLWSAGYEGRDIDSFVASLVDSSIGVVTDVRLTPDQP